MRSLKDFTDLLVPLQEAYGQLETKYELQRAMLHEKHAENARLREACQELVSLADYGGDAVAMLDDAVELARQALKSTQCDHDYQDFGPNERIIGTAAICVKCGAIHPKHLGKSPHGD